MIDDMTARRFSEDTQRDYVRNVRTFTAFLGRPPDTATNEDLRRFQLHMAQQPISPGLINAAVAALRFFFTVTLERPDLVRPLRTVNKPRRAPVVLSQEEVARLLEAAPSLKYKAALSIAYGAGLRVSEVANLKVSDIDSERMMLRVEQGKGQRDRYVMLSPQLLELLRDWWRAARPQVWLFPGQNPINPITPHQLNRAVAAAKALARASPSASRRTRCGTASLPRTPPFDLPERSRVPAQYRAVSTVPERRRRLVGGETPHAEGRRRGASQGRARPATHGGDRDAATWRAAREDRVGPAAPRRRHDRPLREGRCRAPEANRAALAGGSLMLKAIEAYLALRRATGFAMLNAEYLLESFAAFATERGQTHVHMQTAIDWAARGPSVAQRDARLKAVCRFVRHVRVEDARHELPPLNHFGARKTRRSPHIYSAAEIDRLIEAALGLRPKAGLRSLTYATLIALLSVAGLRISEALKLTVADITRDGLLIRETKFRKTRLAPLHDTAGAGLKRYLARHRPHSEADPVFVDARGLPLRYIAVKETFDRLVDRAGVAPAPSAAIKCAASRA